MSVRKIASLTALLSLILLAVASGVVLYAPQDWNLNPWERIHVNLGMLLLTACLVVFLCNIKSIITNLRARADTPPRFPVNLCMALLITTYMMAGSLFELPPCNLFKSTKQIQIQVAAEKPAVSRLPEKLPFLYRYRALVGLCDDYGINTESVVQEMKAFGIKAKPEWSIKHIARENDMESAALFDVIRQLSHVR